MWLDLLRDLPCILELLVAKSIQIEGDGFVSIIRLKHKDEPVLFVIPQCIACLDADVGIHHLNGLVEL